MDEAAEVRFALLILASLPLFALEFAKLVRLRAQTSAAYGGAGLYSM